MSNEVSTLTLPFEPKAMLHRNGGRITKIIGFGHMPGKGAPGGRDGKGRSTDWWFITGDVEWDDKTRSEMATIDPSHMAYEDDAGRAEVLSVCAGLMDYLIERGTWDTPLQGWNATDRSVKP